MSIAEFLISYLFLTCAEAHTIASYRSCISVAVPSKVRIALLIFSFKWSKISILAVIYQVCTYITLLFLAFCYLVTQDFLISTFPNVEQAFTFAVRIQLTVFFLVAMVEEGIYYLKTRRR